MQLLIKCIYNFSKITDQLYSVVDQIRAQNAVHPLIDQNHALIDQNHAFIYQNNALNDQEMNSRSVSRQSDVSLPSIVSTNSGDESVPTLSPLKYLH